MVQHQILGLVVSFYMSSSLAFYPLMIEILQCFIKRLAFFFSSACTRVVANPEFRRCEFDDVCV